MMHQQQVPQSLEHYQQHQQQQQKHSSAEALEAMNRAKAASILQYLDDIDNESCCSSIAPSFRAYQMQQQHQQQQQQIGGDWSPSPSMPSASVPQQQLMLAKGAPASGPTRSVSSGMGAAALMMQQHQGSNYDRSPSFGLQQPQLHSASRSLSQQPQQHHHHHLDVEGSIVSGATASANFAYTSLRRKVGSIVAERDAARQHVAQLQLQLRQLEDSQRSKVQGAREQVEEETVKARRQMQSAVDEHLKCIRKLLAEKENLVKRTEELQAEVASGASKRDAEMKRLRELHEKSLHDLRARLSAQERSKRDEWSAKEAKRIKESTMKAMEPDIALLLNRHKAEKKRLEEELADVQRRRDELAGAKERETSEFKSRLVRELEEAAQKQRDEFRARMQEESDRMVRAIEHEKKAQEERRAALERSHDEVRHALVQQVTDMAKQVAELERRDQQRQCTSATETAATLTKAQQDMAEQHRCMREAIERERAGLAASVQSASEQLLEARTAEIRQQCQAERDTAIARVVERLEQEQLKALGEQREAEKRGRELQAQLQREADRLRTELECTAAHLRSAKEAVEERDVRIKELQGQLVNVKHSQSANAAASEDNFERRLTSLDNTWQQRTQALQAEHLRNTAALASEVQHLRRQMELQKEEHATAANVAAQKHSAELAVITERVTLTMNKKDAQMRQMADTISSLERQLQLREEELASHDALLLGE